MKRILLATLIITILYGCEKEKSESINPTITIGKVTHLDISGAKALYTTVNNISIIQTRDLGTNSSYALYKILADGTSSKIKVQDENGNNIEFFNSKIFPANDNLIAFNFETSEGQYEYYIRKTDGAVFEIPESFWGQYDHEYYIPPYDKFQYIYATINENNNRPIYKIQGNINNKIIANRISDNYIVNQYDVDYNGTVYCRVESTDHLLCILPDGTKVIGDRDNMPSGFTLKKYENGGLLYFEDGKLKQTLINPETQVITHNIIYDPNTPNDIYFSILRKDNMTVAFNKEKVLVIKSPNNIIDYTCAVNSYTIYDIHCTENYLYCEKDGDIFRLNLTNGTKEMIFNGAGNYIFYDYPNIIYSKIYVQSDDIVHFRARKLSTGELVAAKIDKGIFSENTINESNNSTTISFIQIN